jgi:hypothetical protein
MVVTDKRFWRGGSGPRISKIELPKTGGAWLDRRPRK